MTETETQEKATVIRSRLLVVAVGVVVGFFGLVGWLFVDQTIESGLWDDAGTIALNLPPLLAGACAGLLRGGRLIDSLRDGLFTGIALAVVSGVALVGLTLVEVANGNSIDAVPAAPVGDVVAALGISVLLVPLFAVVGALGAVLSAALYTPRGQRG